MARMKNAWNYKYISGSAALIIIPIFKVSIVSPTTLWKCNVKSVAYSFNKMSIAGLFLSLAIVLSHIMYNQTCNQLVQQTVGLLQYSSFSGNINEHL